MLFAQSILEVEKKRDATVWIRFVMKNPQNVRRFFFLDAVGRFSHIEIDRDFLLHIDSFLKLIRGSTNIWTWHSLVLDRSIIHQVKEDEERCLVNTQDDLIEIQIFVSQLNVKMTNVSSKKFQRHRFDLEFIIIEIIFNQKTLFQSDVVINMSN